ncbi:MAG: hypothetical protein ACQETL_19230 [Bacteroidota bacterium]
MKTSEKIILGVGFILLIGVLIYPPVKMEGHSETAEQWQKLKRQNELEHQRYGYEAPWQMMIPTGNHGESDSPYINWTKETRHLTFSDSNFEEDITYLILSEENTDSKSKAEDLEADTLNKENYKSVDGTIEWESQINTGQLLIEILLTIVLTSALFIFIRFK